MAEKIHPKVSVVVPIYNVENFLEEALNSIINQTLKEIEIILVNDGSTDNSFKIIEKYQNKDKRIKVINQENQGLSGARNSGLYIAKGKYIYFMDSDDLIEKKTLEICFDKAEKEGLEVLCFDAEVFSNEDIKISGFNYNRKEVLASKIRSGSDFFEELLEKNIYKSPVWLNFISLNYLKHIKLKFYPRILHEDELFTPLLLIQANRVNYLPKNFFKRRVRSGSIMTSNKNEKNICGYITVCNELLKFKNEISDKRIKNLLNVRVSQLVNTIVSVIEILDKEKKIKYKKYILDNYKSNIMLRSRIRICFPKAFGIIKKIKTKCIYCGEK